MRRVAAALYAASAAALCACSQPAPAPQSPSPSPDPSPSPVATPPVDAAAPNEEEKLAAIQKAMNELDEAAQGCWALAATERYDVAGEVTALIEITPTSANVQLIDKVGSTKLAGCMQKVLGAYRWAPPLHGQAIQLPFAFKAPSGQSVIDRQLVEWKGQANVSVAVLLDESNTGNRAASMFEIAIAPKGTTELRVAERPELWYFLTDGTFQSVEGRAMGATSASFASVKAGAMFYVPKGVARAASAEASSTRAVIVMAPGGREGAARAGALPTAQGRGVGKAVALTGKQHGPAEIFLEPAVVKGTPFSASILELPADAKVAEHVHAGETELLYVLEGSGTMTIAGQPIAVTPTSVIQIPPNTKHAFAASAKVRALQLYTPPGPEQRFKKK